MKKSSELLSKIDNQPISLIDRCAQVATARPNRGEKVCVVTNGCPENRIDGARLKAFFATNGWRVTEETKEADLILFNACGLTQFNEDRSFAMHQRLQATKKPGAEVILYGCLTKISPQRVKSVYSGELFGSDEFESIEQHFEHQVSADEIDANYLIPQMTLDGKSWLSLFLEENGLVQTIVRVATLNYTRKVMRAIHECPSTSYCIKVSNGCLNNCSYCGVKLSRGNLVSKPLESVLREFEAGLRKGYRQFSIMGTDIGCYGRDLGYNLITLLKKMTRYDENFELRLRNVNPRFLPEMLPELCEVIDTGKVPYLISAAQSGSDRILSRMRRCYTVETVRNAIKTLQTSFPQLQLRTQFIVGFPGETKEDFKETISLARELKFDFVEAYAFEARPGTSAAAMADQVPNSIKRRRQTELFVRTLFQNMARKKKFVSQAEDCSIGAKRNPVHLPDKTL